MVRLSRTTVEEEGAQQPSPDGYPLAVAGGVTYHTSQAQICNALCSRCLVTTLLIKYIAATQTAVMKPFLQLLALAGSSLAAAVSSASNFSGNFVICNLIVDSPFQANPKSTAQSSIKCAYDLVAARSYADLCPVDLSDQDTPQVPGTKCDIHWDVGLTPSTAGTGSSCEDKTFQALIPDGSYHGVSNFMLNLSHTYIGSRSVDPYRS